MRIFALSNYVAKLLTFMNTLKITNVFTVIMFFELYIFLKFGKYTYI